jgi:hypothetical protein
MVSRSPALVVTIELTTDVVCDDIGFHVQLNANSPLGSQTHWQQYVMSFNPDFKAKSGASGPVIGSSIEYFAKPNSFNTGSKNPPDVASIKLSKPLTLPAGAKLIIAMQYDGDNISGAKFTYVEGSNTNLHNWTIPVPPPVPPYPKPAVPKSVQTRSSRFNSISSAGAAETRLT